MTAARTSSSKLPWENCPFSPSCHSRSMIYDISLARQAAPGIWNLGGRGTLSSHGLGSWPLMAPESGAVPGPFGAGPWARRA